jgi:uncharacterized Fe-S cluster-containing radical SAM superfamily protein
MKQTAVEWLVKQVVGRGLDCGSGIRMKIQVPKDIAEQAKEIEKQQIIDAYRVGKVEATFPPEKLTIGEQYYNETFKKD